VLVMSSRPGRVKLEARVPFERPRAASLITAADFVAIKRRILDAIRDERQA
jgi:NitT/TauT family transport system ATP-binding protein